MRHKSMAVVLVLAAGCGSAWGMIADVPLPQIIGQSDLVVICTVVEAGRPASLTLKVPGMINPAKRWVRTFRLTVAETLMDRYKAVPGGRAAKIAVMAPAAAPRPAGGPRIMVSDGPAYPNLQPGKKYVLILRKFPDKPEYFLPAYFKNFRPVDGRNADHVAAVRRLANVARWPWGRASDGLQVAIVLERSTVPLAKTRTRGGPATLKAYVRACVALRNTSTKPLAVALFAPDKFLAVSYAQGGKTARCDLYGYLARSRRKQVPFGQAHIAKIEPGKTLMISPYGRGGYGTAFHLPVKAGKVALRVAYGCRRDAKAADGTKLWTGRVESAPTAVDVTAAGTRR